MRKLCTLKQKTKQKNQHAKIELNSLRFSQSGVEVHCILLTSMKDFD